MDATEEHRLTKALVTIEDVEKVRNYLLDRPRDLLMFELGIGSGLRISELLGLRVSDLAGLKAREKTYELSINDVKYAFEFNEHTVRAFKNYREKAGLSPDALLFATANGKRALALSSASNIVRSWFIETGFGDGYGSRSLYKTWEFFNEKARKEHANSFLDTDQILYQLPPVRQESVQDQILNILYEAITMGRIPPGSELVANDLAKQFGVSLTPVRMALTSLEAQGLVFSGRKKASVVRELSIDRIEEIFMIRTQLETLAFEKAWPSFRQQTIDTLNKLLLEYEKIDESEPFYKLHRTFHLVLYSDSNLRLLSKLIGNLHDRTNALRFQYYSELDDSVSDKIKMKNVAKHREIIKSVINKDPNRTIELIKEDIQIGKNNIIQYVLSKQ